MNKKLLVLLCCMMPLAANAAIPYRAQQVVMPTPDTPTGHDSESFAREHRFYVGASYDFSMWNSYTDNANVRAAGQNTSSFDVGAGLRLYDIFRLEANYINAHPKYSSFSLDSHIAMFNAIFDARVGNLYRMFYRQRMVPYVGIGAGLSWNSTDDTHIDDKVAPVVSAMAGLGIEMGEYFTVDLGYKYLYMFSPKFDNISDFNPTANQFRAGVRVNF